LIAALILERPLCRDCLAQRAILDVNVVDDALAALAVTTPIRVSVEGCSGCRTIAMTYRVSPLRKETDA
jgi:hypothetical protein